MRNLYHVEFGNGQVIRGEGYAKLLKNIFKPDSTADDKIDFFSGAALDTLLFGTDIVLDTLQALGAKTAVFLREKQGRWTAVRYESILECPQRALIDNAQVLYQEIFSQDKTDRRSTSRRQRRTKRR